jgi:hypothetical protein
MLGDVASASEIPANLPSSPTRTSRDFTHPAPEKDIDPRGFFLTYLAQINIPP